MRRRGVLGVLVALFLGAGCVQNNDRSPLEPPGTAGRATTQPGRGADKVPMRHLALGKASARRGGLELLWCASGGAPIVGLPVLDSERRTYVATADGYLHSFEADGRYRWSYTVKGTPRGSVSLRKSDGVILMGTSLRYIYAIHPNGQLHWAHRTVSPVWSGLHALDSKTVVFVGLDERLYALSNTGAPQYRVRSPGTPTGDPVVARHNVVWLGLDSGVARFVAAFRLEHHPLSSSADQVVASGDEALARAGGRAYSLQSGRAPLDRGPADFVAASDGTWLIAKGRSLTLSGSVELKLVLEAALSAAPELWGNRLWLALEGGRLQTLRLDDPEEPEAELEFESAVLLTPVVAEDGRFAVVKQRQGTFCAVSLGS